jgi:hypothetical protein
MRSLAQRRLRRRPASAVEQLLGRGHSLASVASWADDVRDARPETYDWHFGDIPLAVRKTIATATEWAIVLDIDETSLFKWERIVHNSFAHVPSGNCDLKSAMGVRARH